MQSTVFRRKFRGASPYKGDLEDMGKVSAFLKRKNVLFSAKRYGIDAMGAMAQGLFASLLIGTIIKTLGQQLNVQFLIDAGNFAQQVAGPAMAVSIGAALSAPQLVLYSLIAVGMALTLPISSAAICAALSLTGLAGGAAVAGCCAQMVGFAVMSFRENGVGGLVSQGLGTSMLQMPNIIRNPRTWIPPTLASAITGPIATCLFHLEMNGPAVSSGMGTCGLVGQIGVYTGWLNDIAAGTKAAILPMDWVGLILICFVLPAVLTLLFAFFLRKWGWIKDGDLKLQ